MWWIIAGFSAFWIFLPEPTDAVPVIGWLDEGVAFFVLMQALEKLGIHIPILHRFAGFFTRKSTDSAADDRKEKDVTPGA